jgi:hypothetical protein
MLAARFILNLDLIKRNLSDEKPAFGGNLLFKILAVIEQS